MLKNKFLGWVPQEFTDLITGAKVTRDVLRETSKLDVGEAYYYTTEIIEWASSIGLEIKIPTHCEYSNLRNAQNQ